PVIKDIKIPQVLGPVGNAKYIVSVDAGDENVIDIKTHVLDSLDTTALTVDSVKLPYLVDSAVVSSDSATLGFKNVGGSAWDSARCYYRDQSTDIYSSDTIPKGQTSITVGVPNDNSILYYYFVIYDTTGDIYSNRKEEKNVTIPINPNLKSAVLYPEFLSGVVSLPKNSDMTFTVQGFNGKPEVLPDSSLKVTWTRKGPAASPLAAIDAIAVNNLSTKLTVSIGGDTSVVPDTIEVTVYQGSKQCKAFTVVKVLNKEVNLLLLESNGTEVDNRSGRAVSFNVRAYDTTGSDTVQLFMDAKFGAVPVFKPPFGMDSVAGIFLPDSSYVGKVRVFAATSLDTTYFNENEEIPVEKRGLDVFYMAKRDSGAPPDTLFSSMDSSLGLVIPSDFIAKSAQSKISIYSPELTSGRRSRADFSIVGNTYNIWVDTTVVKEKAFLFLKIPSAEKGSNLSIAKWNGMTVDWIDQAGARPVAALGDTSAVLPEQANFYGLAVSKFSEFGLKKLAEALGAKAITLRPNPFSPFVQCRNSVDDIEAWSGQRIYLNVSTDANSQIFIKVKVYNIRGELVRNLTDKIKPAFSSKNGWATVNKGEIYAEWDGKTLQGKYARNGRYIIRITINDGDQTMEFLKTSVLFK
ncbi:MAG: hypothetical protein ABIA63_08380, partial [bacterium]